MDSVMVSLVLHGCGGWKRGVGRVRVRLVVDRIPRVLDALGTPKGGPQREPREVSVSVVGEDEPGTLAGYVVLGRHDG